MNHTSSVQRRRNSERFELALDPLKKEHGFLEGFGELLLVLDQHLTVSLHELIHFWILVYASCSTCHCPCSRCTCTQPYNVVVVVPIPSQSQETLPPSLPNYPNFKKAASNTPVKLHCQQRKSTHHFPEIKSLFYYYIK